MKEEEIILRFIKGEMDPSEREAFEKRTMQDADLRESVEQSQHMLNILDKETVDFSNKVRNVIESKRKKKTPATLLIAASVSVILTISLYLLFSTTPTLEEKAQAYLDPYPDIVTSRSDASSIDLTRYNNGEYQLAIESLNKDFNENKEPIVGLYLGVSYLLIDDSNSALLIFGSVPYEGTIYQSDFIWYRSLALINLNRYPEAEKELKKLAKDSRFYAERAIELLDDLE
ncbi:MAG: hypothetical protein AAFY41_00400 [Bacteroidota bacterium]